MFRFLRDRRRRKVRARPFPPEWIEIIERNVPYYGMLVPEEQEELRGHVLVFLAEKAFEGAGGLEITDEIRVTIAAQACLLLLGRDTDYYPGLGTVLVYPSSYFASVKRRLPSGAVVETVEQRLGESWHSGQLVLSWDDVLHGAADVNDGHNVVLHELAHQLDSQLPESEGAPVLPRRAMYTAWARVLGEEYERLVRDISRRRRTVIDRYGATDPAEFFAVATETFFERPEKLKERHPRLYEQLAAFYRQDPVARYQTRTTAIEGTST